MKTMETIASEVSRDFMVGDIEAPDAMELRRDSLARYEYNLLSDESDHPWWPFFDGGMRDRKNALWSVYNRWCDEEKAEGWKVVRCDHDETEFREINVKNVLRSIVSRPHDQAPGLMTFQLYLHDENAKLTNNDVLNVLLYYNDDGICTSKLQMWNQKSAMKPINWSDS